jgi:hypothetical protein
MPFRVTSTLNLNPPMDCETEMAGFSSDSGVAGCRFVAMMPSRAPISSVYAGAARMRSRSSIRRWNMPVGRTSGSVNAGFAGNAGVGSPIGPSVRIMRNCRKASVHALAPGYDRVCHKLNYGIVILDRGDIRRQKPEACPDRRKLSCKILKPRRPVRQVLGKPRSAWNYRSSWHLLNLRLAHEKTRKSQKVWIKGSVIRRPNLR